MNNIPNRNVVFGVVAIIALGCGYPVLGVGSARAQEPVAGWPSVQYPQLKSKGVSFGTRTTVLKNGKFEGDEEEKFTNYYTQSLFPKVTLYNPANRGASEDVIVKLRTDFSLCEKAPDQQVFEKLTDLTLEYMTNIANGHYHPACRVNAVLAIGEANSPKAAKVLLDMAFGKEQVFVIRVAAMTGLIRMAGCPLGKTALSDPVIAPPAWQKMANFAKFHSQKKDDGISWMRGQAADVLGDLGVTGPNNEVPEALRTMLADKDLPIPLRSKAARALGKLNYGNKTPAPDPYLTAIAKFVYDAMGSDQPADRGRVRLVLRDAGDGLKPFVMATGDHALKDKLTKIDDDTKDKMTDEDLKTAIKQARDDLNSLANKP